MIGRLVLAAAILGGLPGFRVHRSPSATPTKCDTGRPRYDPVRRMVDAWLAGNAREEEVLRLGRKCLRSLQDKRGNPAVDASIAKLLSSPLRVLYIEGPPRYEYRFLKNALIRDTKFKVQIFLTTAPPEFPQECTKGAGVEPLREIPTSIEALAAYDVIIVGDVCAERLPTVALASFVRDYGGGVIFISGHKSPRTYVSTALDGILPVAIAEQPNRPEPWKMERTPDGEKFFEKEIPGSEIAPRWMCITTAKQGMSTLCWAASASSRHPLFVTGRGRPGQCLLVGLG